MKEKKMKITKEKKIPQKKTIQISTQKNDNFKGKKLKLSIEQNAKNMKISI